MDSPEPKIFGEIALSLSGGGYRAAAYHLGVLDMLERLELLEDVGSLSTISGGTIAGMFYAVCSSESKSFDDFYRGLYNFLKSRNIVSKAFDLLAESGSDNASPSLITAAAQIYASDDFLGSRKFGLLLDSEVSHLSEQVFNATDFRHGISFRFLKSESEGAVIGNAFASMPRAVAREVRLADIVAASSCFPSVFEPLAFPEDFRWDAGSSIDKVRTQLGVGFEKPIALMDGGIFDNQGVDSIKQVYRREGKEIGLFIISDVDNRADDLYAIRQPRPRGWLSLGALVSLSWGLFVSGVVSLSLLLLFAYFMYSSRQMSPLMIALLFGVPGLFTACVLGAMVFIRGKFIAISDLAERTAGVSLWRFLKRLTIADLINLGQTRASSLITMSSSIFMKRIRDLTFYGLFTHPKYKDRVLPALIYDVLDKEHFSPAGKSGKPKIGSGRSPQKCSEQLQATVKAAREYETNLWFFDEKNLKSLIACGQATVCLKLIRYMEKRMSNKLGVAGSPEERLYERALGLWTLLDEKSYSLLDRATPSPRKSSTDKGAQDITQV